MDKIDFYSGREPYTIEVEIRGEKRELKLPVDFTVEEIERFYEVEAVYEKNPDPNKSRYSIWTDEIFTLLKRYQPEITIEDVKAIPLPSLRKISNFIKEKNLSNIFGFEDTDNGKKNSSQASS